MRMPNKLYSLVLPLLISVLLMTGFILFTGHVSDGPQMIDDNQIYKLQMDFDELGFPQVLSNEVTDRLQMRRLFPVFSIQKIMQARVFGGNMTVWSLYTGLVGGIVAGLLYYFFRLCHGTVLASAAFALICVIGEQSVVWWRLVHGEGIGMLYFSLALVMMAQSVRSQSRVFDVLFLIFLSLASFCKESFILVSPAVLFLKLWLTVREHHVSIQQALRQNWFLIAWFAVLMVTQLAIIKFVFATTKFEYTGWMGFDFEKFQAMVRQYSGLTNVWLLAFLLVLPWVVWSFTPGSSEPESRSVRKKSNREKSPDPLLWTTRPWVSVAMAAVFCLLMTIPQLLLYMSSGMLNENSGHYGRYIFPAIIGYAFLVAEVIRLIQQTWPANRWITGLVVLALAVSLVDKGWTAVEEASDFAVYSSQTDSWFREVAEATDPDDPIVLAYRSNTVNAYSIQVALRVYYILNRCYDRGNVYFCLIPPEPTIEESLDKLVQDDTRRHARRMRTVDQLESDPAVVMVLNWGPQNFGPNIPAVAELDGWLYQKERHWFNIDRYERVVHPLNHLTYFLKDEYRRQESP